MDATIEMHVHALVDAARLGIDPTSLTMVMKQGCSWRVQTDCEAISAFNGACLEHFRP